MTIFMVLGGGLFFVVSSVVGIRLLILARRNRALPELILGIAFVVGGTIGGAFGQVLHTQGHRFPIDLLGPAHLLYGLVSMTGITAYNLFTWRVFQPTAVWARLLVTSLVLATLAQMFWRYQTGAYATGQLVDAQRLVETGLNVVGPAWAMVEAVKYHRQVRRRMAVGLADPVIVNRILLWGLGSALATVIVISSIVLTVVDTQHALVQVNALFIGACGTAASLTYALAFFPPRAYLAWVREKAATQPAGT